MMNLNALKIDPEFQGKIPPLNFEEEQQLEQNILHEGRLLNPIIIWNGFILDGHTRYRILRKHPFIAYQIQEIELANRYAALSWICQNQLGRRNLDPERKKFLMGKLYESEKLARGGSKERAHDENGRFTSMVQNDPLRAKQLSTCERIAAQNGVGAATVKRAEKYAKGDHISDPVKRRNALGILLDVRSGNQTKLRFGWDDHNAHQAFAEWVNFYVNKSIPSRIAYDTRAIGLRTQKIAIGKEIQKEIQSAEFTLMLKKARLSTGGLIHPNQINQLVNRSKETNLQALSDELIVARWFAAKTQQDLGKDGQ